jgi:predicted CoA-binding protein
MSIRLPSLETVEDFLSQKRIAMIGVSRNPKDFSAALFEGLRKRGYEMVPVNPKISEVMDQPCYARVQDIQPPVFSNRRSRCAEVPRICAQDYRPLSQTPARCLISWEM